MQQKKQLMWLHGYSVTEYTILMCNNQIFQGCYRIFPQNYNFPNHKSKLSPNSKGLVVNKSKTSRYLGLKFQRNYLLQRFKSVKFNTEYYSKVIICLYRNITKQKIFKDSILKRWGIASIAYYVASSEVICILHSK